MKKFNIIFICVNLLLIATVGILIGNNRGFSFVSGKGFNDYFNQCFEQHKDDSDVSNSGKSAIVGKCIRNLQNQARIASEQNAKNWEDYQRASIRLQESEDDNERLKGELNQEKEFRKIEENSHEKTKTELNNKYLEFKDNRDKREKALEKEINDLKNKKPIEKKVYIDREKTVYKSETSLAVRIIIGVLSGLIFALIVLINLILDHRGRYYLKRWTKKIRGKFSK